MVQVVEEVSGHRHPSWHELPEHAKLNEMAPQHGDIVIVQEILPEVRPHPTIVAYLYHHMYMCSVLVLVRWGTTPIVSCCCEHIHLSNPSSSCRREHGEVCIWFLLVVLSCIWMFSAFDGLVLSANVVQ